MASRFPLLILTVATIFLLIGICASLPYRRDTAVEPDNCDENVPHVVIINSTNAAKLNCHKCEKCPYEGHGLSIPCNGQNVTQSEINVECVLCVPGVNYSTGDTFQCQPCLPKKCPDGEKMEGQCESEGDRRTCEKCELENWYFNDTQKMCLPCVCHNMTTEIKHICSGLGINLQCDTDSPDSTTNAPFSSSNEERDGWKTGYTIMMTIVACCILFFLVLYFCCVRKRVKKLKLQHHHLSVCSKEWFCSIFFFKKATRSRPPSYTPEDRHAHNGNGCPEKVLFLRQTSCPVTQNEKYVVINSPHASFKQSDGQEHVKLILPTSTLSVCEQKNLKFFDMNSETCRKILQALKHNVDSGMGYPTLAGYMCFSANQVKSFEEDGNPCRNMLNCWSDLDTKENNVLKLKGLVVKLKRDDILELLKSELQKAKDRCGCPECVVV